MTIELRPWVAEDAPALSAAYQENLELRIQFGGANLSTIGQAHRYIRQQLSFSGSSRPWAIALDDVVVGHVGLSAIERRHGTAWASYWLTSEARGHGYAARALATVAGVAFEDGLFRLELGHRINNPASCGVASRAGFLAEGIERQKLQYGTERFDVETHARLRTDPRPDLIPLPISL